MQEPDQGNSASRRRGHTTSVTIGGERFRLTATERADGTLYEVRIECGKHGSGIAGLMDAYGTAISAGLLHGVPLADLLRPGLGLCFAPGGSTDDPEIPRVRSAVDYFSRRLAIDWLPRLALSSPAALPGVVPQHRQGLLDAPDARLWLLRALDSQHVLPLVAEGQAIVSGSGGWVGVQGPGEVRGLDHDRELGVILHVDLDLVAGHDAGRLAVRVAQAEQVPAAHDGDPALP